MDRRERDIEKETGVEERYRGSHTERKIGREECEKERETGAGERAIERRET